MPGSIENLTNLLNGDLRGHAGLMAGKLSLESERSSKNAYLLLLGTKGSGKSTAVNILFNHPNITNVNGPTRRIEEFRIPVPVDELGILNSELRVIDTPGLGNGRETEEDAKVLATLEIFLDNHEELRDRKPNVVLIFHNFRDNRFEGQGSAFVKMLRRFDKLRDRITDSKFSNVVFVFSHFCSATKHDSRWPTRKLQKFKAAIEGYSNFPKPIAVAVAENQGEDQGLPMINGYFKLPNGDYYPKNLFDQIQILTAGGEDPIGDAVFRTAFRNSEDFRVRSSTHELVNFDNSKVTKYLMTTTCFGSPDKPSEVSQRLSKAIESIDVQRKAKYILSFYYLDREFQNRGIHRLEQMPRTENGVLDLLSSLKKLEGTVYLLQNGLGLKLPNYTNPVAGFSYSVFTDSHKSKSPFDLGEHVNSDIGYLLPSAISAEVRNVKVDIFETVRDKAEYLKQFLGNLGLEGDIPMEEFKGQTKPGFNIEENQFQNESCKISVILEIQTFSLNLKDKPELNSEFTKTVKSLKTFNESDLEIVGNWKSFFDEYGTHVVKSVHGGGSIQIELKSNRSCDPDIYAALFQLILFVQNFNSMDKNSSEVLKTNGIEHGFRFQGGDSKFQLPDLTNTSFGTAANVLKEWKRSLRLNPAILTSQMTLIPISSAAQMLGPNYSLEIERVSSLLFNSSLRIAPRRVEIPIDRDHVPKVNENKILARILEMASTFVESGEIQNTSSDKYDHGL